jgi:hypothetical protein
MARFTARLSHGGGIEPASPGQRLRARKGLVVARCQATWTLTQRHFPCGQSFQPKAKVGISRHLCMPFSPFLGLLTNAAAMLVRTLVQCAEVSALPKPVNRSAHEIRWTTTAARSS